MSSVPAPADPGRDEDPAWLDRVCEREDDPFYGPQEYWDPGACAPPPGQDELTAPELAGIAGAAADQLLALDAASTGRRGPGHPGSARRFPGESASRAASFGAGMAWDVTPCRHDHRLKQQPGWNVDQLPDGTFRWTTPSGRQYTTEPTRYPV
jgi:hypothetical protein